MQIPQLHPSKMLLLISFEVSDQWIVYLHASVCVCVCVSLLYDFKLSTAV